MSNDETSEEEPAPEEEPVSDEEAASEGESASEEEPAGLGEGDVIELSYTARTVEDDHLVDTTDPEVAEEEGVGEEGDFEPRTIALGEGHLFDPVEEAIIGSEVGDSGSVVVPAAEAFGEHLDDKVRTVSADKIPEEDRRPGAQVQVGGEQGFLETIVGGRARVDFNHPLAGDDIAYEYEIIEEIEDRQARAEGLLSMFLDVDLDVWFQTDTVEEQQRVEPDEDEADAEDEDAEATDEDDGEGDEPAEPEFETVEVEKESLYIEAAPQLQMDQQWMMQKHRIAQQLMDLVDVDRVVVQEVLDGGGVGMPGMMGGMGGGGDIEAALEEADIDAEDLDVEEVAEEIEDAG